MSNKHRYKKPKQKGQANLFGIHAVTEAWLNPNRDINSLFITEHVLPAFEQNIQDCGLKRPSPQIVEKGFLDKILKGAVHQGIAIDARPLDEVFVTDLIAKTINKDTSVIVMLDQVTDPHNVGAIMRSASAFGADGLIMQRKHSPSLEGVLAKTASGAVEHIDTAYEINLSDSLDKLKDHGYFALGLDERGTMDVSKISKGGKSVIVLGAEGKGLRPKIRDHCDELVRLPTTGRIQSLNVSNAAAVTLYALSTN